MPTLESVLSRLPDCPAIIELKQGDPDLARAVHEVLRRTGSTARVCVGSFHQMGLDVLRTLSPPCSRVRPNWKRAGRCIDRGSAGPSPARGLYSAFQVPQRAGRLRVITPAFLAQAHRGGARVDVWVVDRPEDIERLFDVGVDGVITDRPDLAVPTRDAWVARTTVAAGLQTGRPSGGGTSDVRTKFGRSETGRYSEAPCHWLNDANS